MRVVKWSTRTLMAVCLAGLSATAYGAAPTAVDDAFSGNEDTQIIANVMTNDFDSDGDPIEVGNNSTPPASNFQISLQTGDVTFTPEPGFSGDVTFTYDVVKKQGQCNNDPDGPDCRSNSATVLLSVAPDADTPTLTVANATGAEDAAIPLTINAALSGQDTDGSESLLVHISGVPSGATLSSGTNQGNGVWELTPAQLGGLTFTGAPNSNGSVTLTVQAIVTDSAIVGGSPVTDTTTAGATLTVTETPANDAPTVVGTIANVSVNEDSGPVPVNLAGVFADADIATNGDSLTLTAVPSNATLFGPATGISGNVLTLAFAANQNGTSVVTVTAKDSAGATATTSFNVTVTAQNDAPVVATTIPNRTLVEDDGTQTVALGGVFSDVDIATNGDALTLTVSGVTNPTLYQVAPAIVGNTLTFTPALNQNGTSTVTVRATDSAGANVTTSFTVTITPGNDPPTVATVVPPVTRAEDSSSTTVSLAGVFQDIDVGDSLTLSVAGVSNGTLFSPAPSITGTTLTLSLAANRNGTSTITVRATDTAGANVTTNVNVTVTPVNDAPVVANLIPDRNVDEDAPPIVVDLTNTFSDIDIATNGDVLTRTVTANSNPSLFQSVVVAGNTLTLTLANNKNGSATLTVRATDSAGANVSDTFVVTVNSIDDVPGAVNDNVTMNEDAGFITIPVLANDQLGESPNTIVSAGTAAGYSESTPTTIADATGIPVSAPNGTVTINGTAIEYEPKPNFSGTDFFHYTFRDADGQQSTAQVNITVNAVPDAPQVVSDVRYSMTQGTVLTIIPTGLLDFAFDFDGDPLTVGIQAFPTSGAALTVAANGAFTFTPLPAFTGNDTFRVVFSDGTLSTAPILVTVTVAPTPPPPPPAPAGEVEFDLDLADVPLEDSVSADPNVLAVIDDSGSMDFNFVVDMGDTDGRFVASNTTWKGVGVQTRSVVYEYLLQLNTNTSNTQGIPSQEAIDADAAFAGNNLGFWRARYAGFNPLYYNPKVRYKPWIGLDRTNVPFANANPTRAALDPYDFVNSVNLCSPITEAACTHVDLTATYTYKTNGVPTGVKVGGNGQKNLDTVNYYIPQYYTSTAVGVPAANAQHTQVLINAAHGPFTDGGPNRTDCANPASCTYAEELQNFANWFTYYRSREYTTKAALGSAVSDVTNARVGYTTINDANERIAVASMNASFRIGNKARLLSHIYSPNSINATPVRKGLDNAGKYFECKGGGSFGAAGDSSPGSSDCPILPAPDGICQQNFTLLFSDGFSTQSVTGNPNKNHDGNEPTTSTLFDEGRYDDTVSGTLADIAMYYYERDLHPELANGVPTTERDRLGAPTSAFTANGELMHQHMKTYTIAFGVTGSVTMDQVPTDYTQPFTWPDPTSSEFAKVDDMLHAAVNGRGNFFAASDPVMLAQAFQDAFTEITLGTQSVSAVAFNSTALREQTVEYRGFFNLKFNTGDLRALDVDPATGVVNEATPIWRSAPRLDGIAPDSRVIVTYDRVANQGIPFRWANLNANQKAMMDADEVNFIRGDRTNEEPAGLLRKRPTPEGRLGDIVHSAPVFVGLPRAIRRDQAPFPTDALYSAFRDSQVARLPLVYVAANDGIVHGFDANDGDEVIGFVPNKLMDTSQRFQNDLDQLASIVYSHRFFVDLTPTVEDAFMRPNRSTLTRSWNTIMMGGLRGGGKGYYLLNVTNPGTSFATEAQASGTVLWEFTDADDTYPVDALGTPIGGAVGAVVDAAGQPVKDLGYTFSQPTIVMSNVVAAGTPPRNKWMAVFGNGYNSTHGFAKLFGLFIEDGLDGWAANDFVKLDTGQGPVQAPDPQAGFPNGLSTPAVIDVDLNGTADIAYAGDMLGNLYRFDMRDSNTANWTTTRLFTATYDTGTGVTRQPITTVPFVFKHPTQPGFVVVIGTGSYVTEGDARSTDIQSIYAIWDRGETAPVTAQPDAKQTRLVEQTVTNIVDETQPLFERLRSVSSNVVNYAPDGASGENGVYGWFIDLDMPRATTTLQGNPNTDTSGNPPPDAQFPGERAIRRFVPRGNALLVTTVIPRDANTCLRAPPGSVFPVDLLTGGNPRRPILDLNNDGDVDDDDLVDVGGVAASAGILLDTELLDGTIVDPSVLLGTGDADFLFLSGGSEQQTIRVAGPEDPKTGRLSWRELNPN